MADHIVGTGVTLVTNTFDGGVAPGDRLVMTPGSRGAITFRDLAGAEGNPITIINGAAGQVVIQTGGWLGIEMNNCLHINLSGTGSADTYGFDISEATNAAIFAYKKSRYIEIDHCYIHDIGGAGLRIYTKIEDSSDDPLWVCYDCSVHDCHISDVGTEAMYLGNDPDNTRPGDGLEVYDNYIYDCDWEGIQVKQWLSADIHENYAERTGINTSLVPLQPGWAYGLIHGSSGSIHHNIAINCNRGIELGQQISGAATVHHNLVVRSGYHSTDISGVGIRWYTGSAQVYHNTVVDSREHGVRVSSGVTSGALYNNFIVKWGTACIAAPDLGSNVHHNVCTADIEDAKFTDPDNNDYTLQVDSPAIGQADDGSDCGCYQYKAPSPEPPTETATTTTTVTVVVLTGA